MSDTVSPTPFVSALDKTFDPAAIEAKWYAHWESTGAFRPHRPDAEPFTIVNPPPNVTGSLHIGHALDNTLQDILVRHARLKGKDALWVVGMDHAGIATQMVVERQMAERQQKRTDFTREEFVAKVWEWKAESGGEITQQLRRLGCSMDWSREQFTMDPHFSKAVTKVFVDLYNQGLIYRDKRLVNWDPGLKTAISDLEVETREINGKFWHVRYPLADGVKTADGKDHIVVATTRPETMLADMAVAVNASDERYASVVGKHIILPITGRRIPIITDDHADPELGSGAVKITPGHDTNDFDVGRRAGIEARAMLNMFDGNARVVQTNDGLIPDQYIGLYRFGIEGEATNARKIVVEAMEAAGLLDRVEDRVIQTPFGDRSGVVIEPWLTDQWYVDAATLAKPAIEAVRSGAVEIVPKTWEKTFFNWMENIQPWCVSRQLWWGHRIPVWYGPDDAPFAAESQDEAGALALAHYKKESDLELEVDFIEANNVPVGNQVVGWVGPVEELGSRNVGPNVVTLRRDADVLDTWFSSALWPFATLGWPEDADAPLPLAGGAGGAPGARQMLLDAPTPDRSRKREGDLLARHYPNDVLISGFDILFFWDARMLMQGLHIMRDAGGNGVAPWKTLYLHGLVRAADGSKMSKSKGNTVDPLGLIDRYGADALRFFMAAMESQGRDIKMDDARLEGYRNFATKLWNAARFAQANGIGASTTLAAPTATLPANRWIIGEVAATVTRMDEALAAYRFDEAANAILHFTRDQFCDWYLELIKGQIDDETKAVAGWGLDQILVMLHPFMPFITEELWEKMGDRGGHLLIHADWPEPGIAEDAEAAAEVDWLIRLIGDIRSARSEANVPPSEKLVLSVGVLPAQTNTWVQRNDEILKRLARLRMITPDPVATEGSLVITHADATYLLPFAEAVDVDAERARLTKAIEAATKERDTLAARLANTAFTERAKPEAVDKARADHDTRAAEADRLAAALARLG